MNLYFVGSKYLNTISDIYWNSPELNSVIDGFDGNIFKLTIEDTQLLKEILFDKDFHYNWYVQYSSLFLQKNIFWTNV